MHRTLTAVLLVVSSLGLTASANAAEPAKSLQGDWSNTDTKTRGITRIRISHAADGYRIEAWGACHPTDCEWGRVPLEVFAPSVSEEAQAFAMATWEPGFSRTHVTLEVRDGKLHATSYTIFLDNSKRSNYRSEYQFQRRGAVE